MVKDGSFREDLYYRLSGFPINIPELKDRIEDIELLSKYIIENYCKKFKKSNIMLHESALKKIKAYNWPGNIRELQNILTRAIILCSNSTIKAKDIYIQSIENIELFNMAIHNKWNEHELVKQYAKQVFTNLGESKTKTCEFLDINFKTLQNRLK